MLFILSYYLKITEYGFVRFPLCALEYPSCSIVFELTIMKEYYSIQIPFHFPPRGKGFVPSPLGEG
jgi:hypothetical protein